MVSDRSQVFVCFIDFRATINLLIIFLIIDELFGLRRSECLVLTTTQKYLVNCQGGAKKPEHIYI